MRLRPTRVPLVCLRHVSLFCIAFHPISTLVESYLTINVRTTTTSSPSCARPLRGAFPSTSTSLGTHYATPTTTGPSEFTS